MSEPIFTVVITTHNRQNILPYAIGSVLDQTFKDFELIVVDNGSTDNTQAIVAGIGDRRIRYVSNPKPTNSCDVPRNIGISLASGEYTAFLDDDDIWYPEKLRIVKQVFDEHPGVLCVCHDENRRSKGAVDTALHYGPWCDDMYERLIYDGNRFSSCATTVKTETLKRFKGFDERKEYSEVADYDLWIRMAKAGVKACFIQEILGEFRLTGTNWSTVNPEFFLKQASMIRDHIMKYEDKPLFSLSKRGLWRLFQLYALAAKAFFLKRRYADAIRNMILAIAFLARRPVLVFELIARRRERTAHA